MSYTLASERVGETYSGPSWAPISLWLLSRDASGYLGHYASLLMSNSAEPVWRLVNRLGLDVDQVSAELPVFLAERKRQWDHVPKMSPSEFVHSRQSLARRAEQLAVEAERSFQLYEDEDEVCRTSLFSLMTGHELEDFEDRIKEFVNFQSRAAGKLSEDDRADLAKQMSTFIQHVVPDVPHILRTVGSAFSEEEPFVSKPGLDNAERNFFVKWLVSFFEYEDASPALIAELIGLLFVQGISENEVSKQKARHPVVRHRAGRGRSDTSDQ